MLFLIGHYAFIFAVDTFISSYLIWLYCNKLVLRYVRLRVSDLGQVSIPQPGIVTQVISDLRNAEIRYFSKEIDVHISDTIKTCKVLRTIIGIKNGKNSNSNNFRINGNTVTNNFKIANAFNEFFTTIGPILASKVPASATNPLSFVENVPNSIIIEDVSEQEASNVIKSLNNSSAGWDQFQTSIAKQCSTKFIKPLTALINRSLEKGYSLLNSKELKWFLSIKLATSR